jgi:RNA polymerase sigma-70 factor (sigma-E family)
LTFDEFVDARLGALLRYATVLTCDPYLAEEVVQDVLVRAQSRWSRIVGVDRPEAYVRRMVLNEFLSWRRRMLRRAVPVRTETLEGAAGAVDDPAVGVAERDAMVALIAGLPRRQRAVVVLRYYEGHSDTEIAELLGCGVGTVRSHASRALGTLRGAVRPSTEHPALTQGDLS